MAYSTKADILMQIDQNTLIELTDDSNTGAIDDNVVERAIEDADSMIDSYLATQYSVPLTEVPTSIRKISVDIAIYNLYSRRGDTIPDIRKDRFNLALQFLQNIQGGNIKLFSDNFIEFTTNPADKVFTIGKPSQNVKGTLDDY